MIYYQNDPTAPGFNPNEEHALLAGSNIFAIRNDLNTQFNLSEPYVLLKYKNPVTKQWKMRVFKVGVDDFTYQAIAGQMIIPPSPLNILPPMEESKLKSGDNYYLEDHKGGRWAKAAAVGNEPQAKIVMHWYYPLQPDFFYPFAMTAEEVTKIKEYKGGDGLSGVTLEKLPTVAIGEPIPFSNKWASGDKEPADVTYNVNWPDAPPILTIGETLDLWPPPYSPFRTRSPPFSVRS